MRAEPAREPPGRPTARALPRLDERLRLDVAGSPKTCMISKGDAMNWTRRWIAMALAAGLTAVLAAMAAPAASAATPAVAPAITTDLSSSFTATNPCTARTGTVEVARQDVLRLTDFRGG